MWWLARGGRARAYDGGGGARCAWELNKTPLAGDTSPADVLGGSSVVAVLLPVVAQQKDAAMTVGALPRRASEDAPPWRLEAIIEDDASSLAPPTVDD